ncbi:hypothetical protein C7S18_00705 [Ahniella affigens]|uniref:DUF4166 domain-containing protein n=1 Tax=Ahniella affigens TaxID=2021234 RepID=A0A2P1PLT9_9GAMM|nr:DUF4166 domain-containing protein [Ahniella affigens]AVP95807.1 hypothetical protein C7S18_00705 [Ahniella affigens]
MSTNAVVDWFGPHFTSLHPLLQDLHRHGGQLQGQVDLEFGSGLAGLIGRRLARKLGLPTTAGPVPLRVIISHQEGALHWSRRFEGLPPMHSVFEPHGHFPEGHWLEQTGPLRLCLGVDIEGGGWRWVPRRVAYHGIRLPLALFPTSEAGKRIVNDEYEFSVRFSLPGFGLLLRYGGCLQPLPAVRDTAA